MGILDNHTDEVPSLSYSSSKMLELATWWARVFALIIDVVVIATASVVVVIFTDLVFSPPTAVTTSLLNATSSNGGFLAGHSIYWYELAGIGVASFLYFAILDGRTRTIGKLMVGIAVRDQTTGQPIGIPRAFVRWMIYLALWEIFFIPGILNALSPTWDRRRQAWHDHAVGAVVLELD